jgi:hypothetical protein
VAGPAVRRRRPLAITVMSSGRWLELAVFSRLPYTSPVCDAGPFFICQRHLLTHGVVGRLEAILGQSLQPTPIYEWLTATGQTRSYQGRRRLKPRVAVCAPTTKRVTRARAYHTLRWWKRKSYHSQGEHSARSYVAAAVWKDLGPERGGAGGGRRCCASL